MVMSESSWSISEKAVLELIELALDGQMTVETFTELAEHLDETWEEAVVEIIEYRSSLSAKITDEIACLTGSSNSSKKHLTLVQTAEQYSTRNTESPMERNSTPPCRSTCSSLY